MRRLTAERAGQALFRTLVDSNRTDEFVVADEMLNALPELPSTTLGFEFPRCLDQNSLSLDAFRQPQPYTSGRSARSVLATDCERRWDQPLADVRREFGIVPLA